MIWKLLPFASLLIFLALGQYGADHHIKWVVVLAIPFWFLAFIGVIVAAVREKR